MEEGSTLKLVMLKGPREGETLEFGSGSVVRIGRVVRGNSIAIKDSGISSKHLFIRFDSDSGKWVLSDLDSSNGTFLNETQIPPNLPFPLSDGDTIKVGEYTSICVNLEIGGSVQVRRNPRRRAAAADSVTAKSELGGDESGEVGLGVNGDLGNDGVQKLKPRGRPRKDRALENEVPTNSFEAENVKEIGNVGSTELTQGRQLRCRSTRNSKKEVIAPTNSVLGQIPEDGEVSESLVVAEKKPQARRGRRTKKNVEDESLKSFDNGVSDKKEVDENLATGLSEGVDFHMNSTVDGPTEQFPVDSIMEPKEAEENLVNELSERVQVVDFEQKEPSKSGGVVSLVNDLPERVQVVDEQNEAGKSGVKESSVDLREEPDLEKMTLGDWFDYLEVFLPKQIYEETEEIISSMRQRAEQFHEYMLQQKHALEKGKSPMA